MPAEPWLRLVIWLVVALCVIAFLFKFGGPALVALVS
jgi:hypothetical protein